MSRKKCGVWALPRDIIFMLLEYLSPVDYVNCLRTSKMFVRNERQYQNKILQHRGKWFITREKSREKTCEYMILKNTHKPWRVSFHNGDICIHSYKDAPPNMYEYQSDAPPNVYDFRIGVIDNWIGLWAPEDCDKGGEEGNTILVHISSPTSSDDRYHYLLICDRIIEFWTEQPICFYESPLGNGDNFYPFALTQDAILFLSPHEMLFVNLDHMHTLRDFGTIMKSDRSATLPEVRSHLQHMKTNWKDHWTQIWWGICWSMPPIYEVKKENRIPIDHQKIYHRRAAFRIT